MERNFIMLLSQVLKECIFILEKKKQEFKTEDNLFSETEQLTFILHKHNNQKYCLNLYFYEIVVLLQKENIFISEL